MAKYKVEISNSAEKVLKRIPKKDVLRIIDLIDQLRVFPFPEGCRKLKGEDKVYRIRQGRYRIIYEVLSKKLLIRVLKIGNRKYIYKKNS